eukprot:6213884-Pleurochrysis_carterae.AAC.2
MPVAAADLKTQNGDYSGFRTAQGARQIMGQRIQGAGTAPGARRQATAHPRRPPAGEEGQRKAPGGGGQNKGAR